MKLSRAKSINGLIGLPGDKSISHRAAILAAIAHGETRISNFSPSADCSATLDCLASLGVKIKRDVHPITIYGSGKYGLSAPDADLDCANSGTTMRLLAGILAGQDFVTTLAGDNSLERRPMQRIIEPLTKMGAAIKSENGRAPLTIEGTRPLRPIEYSLPVASAQIKSCVLLAGLFSEGSTSVTEQAPTRDHTERILREFGVKVEAANTSEGRKITVPGEGVLTACDIAVPCDISAAAFFIAAAASLKGSDITLPNVGINPTRTAFLKVLDEIGAKVELSERREGPGEPTATIRVLGGLPATMETPVIGGDRVPNLIDEIPVLAILGTQLDRGLEVRDAAELRVKESDRIAAVCENLRRMNARVEETDDGFCVFRSDLRGARIESYGDHRIAMSFAVAGLIAKGVTEIVDVDCVAVSFPGFFETLDSVIT